MFVICKENMKGIMSHPHKFYFVFDLLCELSSWFLESKVAHGDTNPWGRDVGIQIAVLLGENIAIHRIRIFSLQNGSKYLAVLCCIEKACSKFF